MKNLVIVAAFVLASFSASAQEGVRVGGFIGIPTGDFSNLSSIGIGLDAKYLFAVSDNFNAGVATGYSNFFAKDIELFGFSVELDNLQFIPIAASAQYMFADKFSGVLDLGYAIGLTEGIDGGFYYRPGIAYGVSENVEIGLSYSGVSVDNLPLTWSSINLGVLFSL